MVALAAPSRFTTVSGSIPSPSSTMLSPSRLSEMEAEALNADRVDFDGGATLIELEGPRGADGPEDWG